MTPYEAVQIMQDLLRRVPMLSNLNKLAYGPTIYKYVFNMATSVCTILRYIFFACLSEFMWEAQLRTLPHSLKTATTGMQICTDKVTAIEAETTLFTLDY